MARNSFNIPLQTLNGDASPAMSAAGVQRSNTSGQLNPTLHNRSVHWPQGGAISRQRHSVVEQALLISAALHDDVWK